jgi:predicted nucleotidyltransferase
VSVSPASIHRHRLDAQALQRLECAAEQVFGAERDVVAVYLYGSAARAEPARDLDIAVLFRSAPSAPAVLERMAADLQRHGAPHGPEIDLRPLNGTAPRFQASVLREGKVLVDRDPPARVEAEARALSAWLDYQPVWQHMRRRMGERLSHG